MNHEERQAQLLDDYLTALQKNPDAPIPDELEPEMADFARMFMTESQTEDSSPAKYRVWQQIHATQNEKEQSYQERETHMTKFKDKKKPSGRFGGWLPMSAVALLVIVFGIGAIGFYFKSSGNIIDDPVAAENFALTGTAIIEEATRRAASPLQVVTATPIVFLTDTPDIVATTQMAEQFAFTSTPIPTVTATFTPTAILPTVVPPDGDFPTPSTFPFSPQQSGNPLLECDFEGELAFQISQNTVNENDTLLIWGGAFNGETESMILEIFGGFITDDEYQDITTISPPPFQEVLLAQIQGTAYEPGSYLIQLRMVDEAGETLSSCGLPVTFTGE